MKLLDKAKKTKDSVAKQALKTEADQTFKCYKKLIRKVKKKYHSEFNKKLKDLKTSNPREYWNLINNHDKPAAKESKVSLRDLTTHFQSLAALPATAQQCQDVPVGLVDQGNEQLNATFTLTEIQTCIRKLKNKASGAGNILNEFLKNCPDKVLLIIVKLFNMVLESSVVPSEWCTGIIQALFKGKGSDQDPSNYRGITLLSCVGKLFTACLNNRLSKYTEEFKILGNEQAGFRSGFSTVDHIFSLNVIIDYYIKRGKRLYCAFVDYSKAFDTINRAALWEKVINAGVNGKFLKIIYQLYKQAKSCVKKDSMFSDFFPCEMGVRQGENLSPLLFTLFLNDFKDFISTSYRGLDLMLNTLIGC